VLPVHRAGGVEERDGVRAAAAMQGENAVFRGLKAVIPVKAGVQEQEAARGQPGAAVQAAARDGRQGQGASDKAHAACQRGFFLYEDKSQEKEVVKSNFFKESMSDKIQYLNQFEDFDKRNIAKFKFNILTNPKQVLQRFSLIQGKVPEEL